MYEIFLALLMIVGPFLLVWMLTHSYIMLLLTPIFYVITIHGGFALLMMLPLMLLTTIQQGFKCPLGCGYDEKIRKCMCTKEFQN